MKTNTQGLKKHKEKELESIIEKIQQLRIKEETKRKEIKDLSCEIALEEANCTSLVPTYHATPVDRYGKRLKKGQKVKLLTKGKFHCDTGIIKKIRNTTAVIKTTHKRETWRLHHNIAVLEK